MMNHLDPGYPLAPSEMVYLNGEQFARTARLGHRLIGKDIKVHQNQLAEAIFTAALLGAEAAGLITFELSEKGGFLGGARKLTVAVTGEGAFPTGSFEAQLPALIHQLDSPLRSRSVRQIMALWLRRDSDTPVSMALEKIQKGLDGRGLLEQVGEKKLIFTVMHYELTGEAKQLAEGAPVAVLQGLLSSCQENRPELWKSITHGIKHGFDDRRTDVDD